MKYNTFNIIKKKGLSLENDINLTNKYYRNNKIAFINKKATNINVVKTSNSKVVEGYYQEKSTTDYCGLYSGFYIDFEAKETNSKTSFNLSLLKQHQYNHLLDINNNGGISFIIVRFTYYNENYIIMFNQLMKHTGSIKYTYFKNNCYLIPYGLRPLLDYITILNKIIKEDLQ